MISGSSPDGDIMNELLQQFDCIIEDAPLDFLGTGGDSKWAAKQEKEWQQQVKDFREKLEKLIEK